MSVISARQAQSLGYTEAYITYPALGDQLLLLYAARIRRAAAGQRTLVGTTAPQLFENSAFCDVLEGLSALTAGRLFAELSAAGLRVYPLTGFKSGKTADGRLRFACPQRHLLAELCSQMGLSGQAALDPVFDLTEEEKTFGRFFEARQIAVMSEGVERRKTWGAEKTREVIRALKDKYNFVQIGAPGDAPLQGALDKRGAFPLRMAAAVLRNSDLFVGGIGALMHLARGVNCPSVIAYSLSEPLAADSYPCNANILAKEGCNLCQTDMIWADRELEKCHDNFSCIRNIAVADIVAAIDGMMHARPDGKQIAEIVEITANRPEPLNAVTARGFALVRKHCRVKKPAEKNGGGVSVIIPCRNGVNYLAEAVAGLRGQAALLEIIVVDDASTDGTAALAERLGCRVVRHETMRGQAAGKNTGLAAAQGEYILFHDHDDVMREGALAALRKELAADEGLLLVMARMRDFFSPDLPEAERAKFAIHVEPYHGLFSGAVLMRRRLFDLAGPLDERLNTGEFLGFLSNMDALGLRYKKIDLIACERRIHASNYGRTHADKERRDYLAALRAKLRRSGSGKGRA